MKKLLSLLFVLGLTLSACGPSQTQSAPPAQTSTPSLTSTVTQTPISPTATVTPLPTIPTFTPTFDVSTIVTVTPAKKEECPKEDPSVVAKFATPNSDGSYEVHYAPEILDYLNSGGTIERLQNAGLEKIVDLTGDGVNEVGYRDSLISYSILGCKDGKYQDLLHIAGDFGAELGDVLDLNNNGMPEVILYNLVQYGYIDISIFEWNGIRFQSLIDTRYERFPDDVIDWVDSTDFPKYVDTNGDGLKEILLVFYRPCGGFGDFCDGTPRRQETTVLAWNGQYYVVQQNYYAPAQYRFQAIQDGDAASSQKEYDKALSLYQEAISSNMLKSYSLEISDNLRAQYDTQYGTTPTPTPLPIAVDEYPRLAAYAYYRIMLLHLVQGQEAEATSTYQTLQETFGNIPTLLRM